MVQSTSPWGGFLLLEILSFASHFLCDPNVGWTGDWLIGTPSSSIKTLVVHCFPACLPSAQGASSSDIIDLLSCYFLL